MRRRRRLQGCAVAYGIFLLSRRQGAVGAWLFLLDAMLIGAIQDVSSAPVWARRAVEG
jgi:hypothetical protein